MSDYSVDAQYQHCSMFGSYWVDCQITDLRPTRDYKREYFITYYDMVLQRTTQRWVDSGSIDLKEDYEQ